MTATIELQTEGLMYEAVVQRRLARIFQTELRPCGYGILVQLSMVKAR